ncbi:MAG: hypothetical protein OEO82_06775 [Gammaproteobacteria bacterium]|nr:hypothetical protein [Gammaproteobacteria bacterium]
MNHRIARLIFGFGVGLFVAVLAYRWAVDPAPRAQRELEESAVAASRGLLTETLAIGALEIVDPLAPDRKVGKTYVYRAGDAWEVSGYYRRDDNDLWHPYLVKLDASLALQHLKIADSSLLDRDNEAAILEVLP